MVGFQPLNHNKQIVKCLGKVQRKCELTVGMAAIKDDLVLASLKMRFKWAETKKGSAQLLIWVYLF